MIAASAGLSLRKRVPRSIFRIAGSAQWQQSLPSCRPARSRPREYAELASDALARVLFARSRERFLFGYPLAVDCGAGRGCRRRAVVRGDRCSRVLEADVLYGDGHHGQEGAGGNKGRPSGFWSKIWPTLAATAAMTALVLRREFAFARRSETPLVGLVLLSASGAATYVYCPLGDDQPAPRRGCRLDSTPSQCR